MKLLAALLTAMMFITSAYAETAADVFAAQHWPAGPALIVDGEPRLCSEVLSDAKEKFASSDPVPDFSQLASGSWEILKWNPILGSEDEYSSSFLGRLDLDLDGNGTKQVVISRSNEFGSKGYWNYAYVFQSADSFDAISEKLIEAWSKLPKESQYPLPSESEFGERQYYPEALGVGQTGNVWTNSSLISWHGKYYFFYGHSHHDLLYPSESSLFRLHGNGTVSEVCRIGIKGEKDAYEKFLATPGIGSLLKILRTIGEGGEDCGTAHYGMQHNVQAAASERRAAIRPWAVSIARGSMAYEKPYYVFDERTIKFLDYWSREDLWTRREFQTFGEHIKPAEKGVASYLVNEFAIKPKHANSEAYNLVEKLIGTRFIIPGGFDLSENMHNLYFGKYSIDDALIERNKHAFDDMLSNPSTIPAKSFRPSDQLSDIEKLSAALFYAVEWPYGMGKLLGAGASPNGVNGYGKTPLMVAAHMGRPDAVRMFLEAHADVNAVTHNVSGFCMRSFERVNRSALTYAAENASPIVMKLLLDAGADPNILDSKGNGLDYYLARNPRLTPDEQKLGITGLAKIADSFTGPSFNCKDAKSGIEKRICASEVLGIFDLEIARAYEALHASQGASALTDQRDWLKRRNTTCKGSDLTEDCLAEVMRTRVRYLHNRIGENNRSDN